MDVPNVPEVLRLVETAEIECRIEAERDAFRIQIERRPAPTIAAEWRQRLFLATSAITADAAELFNLPRNRA